jgi:hypothetical protein
MERFTMALPSWLVWLTRNFPHNHAGHARPATRHRARPTLQPLEERTLPSTYTAGSVAELIADIKASNLAGGSNTITLMAGTTFTLTAANNSADGATGLPVITAGSLTINGNADTIERSTAAGTPAFRLFDVAAGASLTLTHLTLQGGWAKGAGGVSSGGGAILNQGTLALSNVTVQNNIAQGLGSTDLGNLVGDGSSAAGGAIYSSGTLTMQDSIIRNNQAVGGKGGREFATPPGAGSNAFGGGLYIEGGNAALTRVTVSSNTAQGGAGGDALGGDKSVSSPGAPGGTGLGGGLYVHSGTVTLASVSMTQNGASGGAGGSGGTGKYKGPAGPSGLGEGGGIYVDPLGLVYLDLFTQANVKRNHASTRDPDIAGPTILL